MPAHQERGYSKPGETEEGHEGRVARAVDHRGPENDGSRGEGGRPDVILSGELAAAVRAHRHRRRVPWPGSAGRAWAMRGETGDIHKPLDRR